MITILNTFYSKSNTFLKYFSNYKDCFPMIVEYLDKDNCYLDDDWIKWFSFKKYGLLIAFLAERKIPLFENSKHIAVFEVNTNLRNCGFGTKLLKSYLNENPSVSLYSLPKNESFYKFLGFTKCEKPYLYTRGI